MTALFLLPPAHGHLNRSFPVARQLHEAGYRVVYGFMGPPDVAKSIAMRGFELQGLQTMPFGVGMDEVTHQDKPDSYLETLLDRLTNRLFRERTADLTRLVGALKPTLIVLDVFMSTDFIILYPLLQRFGGRVVLLQTMLSSYDDGFAPPLNTALVPGQHAAQAIRRAWQKHYARRTLQWALDALDFPGRRSCFGPKSTKLLVE